jgi:hypothetical protein
VTDSQRMIRVVMTLGLVLIFTSMVLYRPYSLFGGFSVDLKDTVHWYGITGGLLFVSSTVLRLKGVQQMLRGRWLSLHCLAGVLSLVFAALHSRSRAAVIVPLHYSSYFILVLMAVVVVSGLAFSYLSPNKRIVKTLRLFHGPSVAAIYLSLVYHVLVKTALI